LFAKLRKEFHWSRITEPGNVFKYLSYDERFLGFFPSVARLQKAGPIILHVGQEVVMVKLSLYRPGQDLRFPAG